MNLSVLSRIILFLILTLTGEGAFARERHAGEAYDWWLTPHRLLQTNLREIDAAMDTDRYVREVKTLGANIVLFNVGEIVANYPTELEYHWRNTFMKDRLIGSSSVCAI